MKKLQKDYTTPEQSKRLLELGVPADSADCYHDMSLNRRGVLAINGVYSKDVPYNHLFSDGTHRYLPCWTVGRLMEIFDKCFDEGLKHDRWESHKALYKGQSYIDYIMYVFEHNCVCVEIWTFQNWSDYDT